MSAIRADGSDMKQIPLAIQPQLRAGFSNYLGGANQAAVSALQELLSGAGEPQLYIWSPTVLGKTHLLQALCHDAGERGMRCAYVPLAQFVGRSSAILDGLEFMDLVCVDDAHLAFGHDDWEEALFNLINRCRENHCHLVFSAVSHPDTSELKLNDLRSRLLWGPVFRLQDLSDDEKQCLLRGWLAERGLELEPSAASYLLQHYHRDLGSLNQVLELLDRESMIQKRRLSIPFIRSVLTET